MGKRSAVAPGSSFTGVLSGECTSTTFGNGCHHSVVLVAASYTSILHITPCKTLPADRALFGK